MDARTKIYRLTMLLPSPKTTTLPLVICARKAQRVLLLKSTNDPTALNTRVHWHQNARRTWQEPESCSGSSKNNSHYVIRLEQLSEFCTCTNTTQNTTPTPSGTPFRRNTCHHGNRDGAYDHLLCGRNDSLKYSTTSCCSCLLHKLFLFF